jgi:hypothetical protein
MAAYLFEPAPAASPTYDYGSVYGNISTYLNQVREELADIDIDTTATAATLLLIATSLGTMATNSTTMATKLTAIETYQKKMKELGEGDGIHFIGPYEIFGLVSIYRMMIEQAKILESTGTTATPEQVTQALVEVRRLSELIKNNISKDF